MPIFKFTMSAAVPVILCPSISNVKFSITSIDFCGRIGEPSLLEKVIVSPFTATDCPDKEVHLQNQLP